MQLLQLVLSFCVCVCVYVSGHTGQGNQHNFDHYIREDKDHLKEDIKEQMNVEIDPSKMSEDEMQFYYFSLHDSDHNNRLDGTEVLMAILHDVPHDIQGASTTTVPPLQLNPEERYNIKKIQEEANKKYLEDAKLVDEIMSNYDLNNDGFIEFEEFVVARREEMKQYNG